MFSQKLVIGVLAPARRAKRVVLRLHPEDAPVIRASEAFSGATVVEDDTLQRGDCVVDTELGVMDGTLRVRIEALQEALR